MKNKRSPTTQKNANLAYGAMIGGTITAIFLVVIIVWAEMSAPLKTWLGTTFSHHWTGKGILATVAFFASGLIASTGQPKTDTQIARAGVWLYAATLGAASLLALYFLYHVFTL